MKKTWKIIIASRDSLEDQVYVDAVDCRMIDNSMVLIDEIQLTFNHSFVLKVELAPVEEQTGE